MNKIKYLKLIEQVIENGYYKANWKSLSGHEVPKWYSDAKFGIFIHWGVYSVPAYSNEWYPRNMYLKDSKEYDYHVKTFGPHNKFGYKDFIPMFKAEKFDADEWMSLFKESGAKYIMPVAEHHDGFQMYNSDLSNWNAVIMGPQKDILGELKAAAEKQQITFCASSHRAEHFWFLNGGREFESDVNNPSFQDFYGPACKGGVDTHNVLLNPPTEEYLEDWLVRTCEIVDKYRPKIVWFDWWIHQLAFKPYLKKFAAYYYNRAIEWGEEVTINYKYEAFAPSTAVFDIERGQLDSINPRLWQNDTAIAKNSWGYTENNEFKQPKEIICDLVDIVSKNGCLLLNIGPKSDGTISDEEKDVLLKIGLWLKVNGEGIYESTFWHIYGEGPTQIPKGAFSDTDRSSFTSEDIRFTYKDGYVYAYVMQKPLDSCIKIKNMKSFYNGTNNGDFEIRSITVLGYGDDITYTRTNEALEVKLNKPFETDYPICLKIEIN